MKDKKLYLCIVKSDLVIRDYKTKKIVTDFSYKDVLQWINRPDKGRICWQDNIDNIYDYLLYECKIIYVDSFGRDRLTDKGLNLYWQDKRAGEAAIC
jgi:hypothetical protein